MLAPSPPLNVRVTPGLPGTHAYFEWLRSRPEIHSSYSLRDNAQLIRWSQQPRDLYYLWPDDPDPRRQDAAKLVLPSDGSGVKSPTNRNSIVQMRFPQPKMELGHSYLTTWDAFYGAEWDERVSGIGAHKAFQFDGADGPTGNPQGIWWEVSHRYTRASSKGDVWLNEGELARVSVRHYAGKMNISKAGRIVGNPIGPNITSSETPETPIRPYREWRLKPERWTRYWQLIEYGMDVPWFADRWPSIKARMVAEREAERSSPNVTPERLAVLDAELEQLATMGTPAWVNTPGTWMSMWMADEDREPFQVYDRLQVMLWPPGNSRFWIEFNTSQNDIKPNRGNLIAYFRNIVMLKDADVSALLQKPVR